MVLAPYILAARPVLINKRFPVLVEGKIAYGSCQHQFRAAAFHRYAVQFGNPSVRKHRAARRVLDGGREINLPVVRRKAQKGFPRRMGGHALRRASGRRHSEDIHAALAVRDKCQYLAVVRPDRRRFITVPRSQLPRHTAPAIHHVNISLISKCNLTAVGRNRAVTHPQRARACHQRIAQQ